MLFGIILKFQKMKSFFQRLQENDADTPITKSYVENTGLGSASITLFIVKNNTVDIKSRNPILPKYQSIILFSFSLRILYRLCNRVFSTMRKN